MYTYLHVCSKITGELYRRVILYRNCINCFPRHGAQIRVITSIRQLYAAIWLRRIHLGILFSFLFFFSFSPRIHSFRDSSGEAINGPFPVLTVPLSARRFVHRWINSAVYIISLRHKIRDGQEVMELKIWRIFLLHALTYLPEVETSRLFTGNLRFYECSWSVSAL